MPAPPLVVGPLLCASLAASPPSAAPPARGLEPVAVVRPVGASSLEAFAAREVRRYVYVTTGRLAG